MIRTFYGLGTLDTASAFFAALIIGFFFGLALERAGFGSSRRLAGIFYFRDMAVLKVMFTALLTAMLGLSLCIESGMLDPATELYYMKTYYGAYKIAGLIFGIGFVMGGWCPGTAAVGLASGKTDALVFLIGAGFGSILFNELFPVIKPLYTWGQSAQENFGQPGLAFVYNSLGMSRSVFALLFTLIAVSCFWGAEYIERVKAESGPYFKTPFLKAFSLIFIVFSASMLLFSGLEMRASGSREMTHFSETSLLASVESAEDHLEPEELASELYNKNPNIVVADVRPAQEYAAFHIRGAVNVQLPDLPEFAEQHKQKDMIVLYSNGMTHPAQARDSLFRLGYRNVYILTDGLTGFIERCLKPVSLRSGPMPPETASQIAAWRDYFYTPEKDIPEITTEAVTKTSAMPGLADTSWLAENLGRAGLKIIDAREQPEYNRSHIPGSFSISCESFRGVVAGVPSVLLPAEILAQKFSLMGIEPTDTVVLLYSGDKVRDVTMIGMAFERLGHRKFAILDGGFDKWAAEGKPVSTDLPPAYRSNYPVRSDADHFTVDYRQVLLHVKNKSALIIDVRPTEYYTGEKSDEARAGHIPGAVNRPFKEDLLKSDKYSGLKSKTDLEAAYSALIPSKDTRVIVHCRTGHQASQTFFVLKHLLGYTDVLWYDASWTEWAARKELPVETGSGK